MLEAASHIATVGVEIPFPVNIWPIKGGTPSIDT